MGRYLRYRIQPFSCGELLRTTISESLVQPPLKIEDSQFDALMNFGGFLEPLFKQEKRFYRNWSQLRLQQLFYEDIRDLTRIQEIKQMELLAFLLSKQVGTLLNYSSLAKKVRVFAEAIRRRMNTLTLLYYSFHIQPWKKNITRALLKETKVYLWDWSLVQDGGARSENFIASHLMKACHFWTDKGEGFFELYFLRDKEKREVNFLVVKDEKPWFLVEVKTSRQSLSPHLEYFQKATGSKHAFQVTLDEDFQDVDCFAYTHPIIVSAKTFFLSWFNL